MKIGLLVDGLAEVVGLSRLLPRIESPHQILRPLRCDLQPFAKPTQMALAASKQFPILLRWKVDRIILLIDKESRSECTVELARDIERAARSILADSSPSVDLHVVLKVSMLENWLIADPQALRELPRLVQNPDRIARQVSPGRADAVDALALLKTHWGKREFKKPECALAICQKLEPGRAAKNSRSFRKLLKTLGHPDYAEPAPPVQARARRTRRAR